MVYVVENDEGVKTIEAAKAFELDNRYHVLGAIERMKMNYMAREWKPE